MADPNEKNLREKAALRRQQQAERIAESIKEQERRKEERKFQEEWNKRVVIAREGRVAYERNDPVKAVLNYKKILSLTARRHNVEIEDLHPKLFDAESRISECLLLSALCFDLAKIIERLEGDSARRDVVLYLKLFVIFSKGMPFEVIALSTIRKYVEFSHGLKHRSEFEAAYNAMKKGRCFVATAVFGDEEAPEVLSLREFRDTVLRRYVAGRCFTALYTSVLGPFGAELIERFPRLRPHVRRLLKYLVTKISA